MYAHICNLCIDVMRVSMCIDIFVHAYECVHVKCIRIHAHTHMAGASEEIIGRWLAKEPTRRANIILATKVMGYSGLSDTAGNRKVTLGTGGKILENGKPQGAKARLDRESILEACEASLKRLQTDYIDVYQLHWPDRYAPTFGALCYDPKKERAATPFAETVAAIKELIDSGKIKYWGLSNESTFGVCELIKAADASGCPRPVSIQNQFSLLYRPFEGELAEACAPSHYDIGLLPWTPLGGGMLTDKYIGSDGKVLKQEDFPKDARFGKYVNWMVRMKQGTPLSPSYSHTDTLTHVRMHTCTHAHAAHMRMCARTHTHTRSVTHTHIHLHIHTCSLTQNPCRLPYSHFCSFCLSRSLTNSLSRSLALSLSHSLPSLSLSRSPTLSPLSRRPRKNSCGGIRANRQGSRFCPVLLFLFPAKHSNITRLFLRKRDPSYLCWKKKNQGCLL